MIPRSPGMSGTPTAGLLGSLARDPQVAEHVALSGRAGSRSRSDRSGRPGCACRIGSSCGSNSPGLVGEQAVLAVRLHAGVAGDREAGLDLAGDREAGRRRAPSTVSAAGRRRDQRDALGVADAVALGQVLGQQREPVVPVVADGLRRGDVAAPAAWRRRRCARAGPARTSSTADRRGSRVEVKTPSSCSFICGAALEHRRADLERRR